jgi:D-3-phosphoglycerate dehydrogenase
MKFRDHLDYFGKRVQEAEAEIVPVETSDEQTFQHAVSDASAIVVIDRRISAKTILQLTKCEHILALSVGFDCVDVEAATVKRIPVSNVPAYCTDDVANHALALLLSITRKIPLLIEETKAGQWDYNPARKIFNYREKTLGIVGLGKIGRTLVPKAQGFGLNVTAFDPYLADDIFELLGVHRWYEFDELLENADYVSIHAPLTQETYHLVDERAFDTMKETAYIVNTARGKIIHEEALYQALSKRRIAGAAIDVLEIEPLLEDNKLLTLENIIVTPHIAWYSEESFHNSMVQGCDETVRVLNGLRPRFIVNPEVLGKKTIQ